MWGKTAQLTAIEFKLVLISNNATGTGGQKSVLFFEIRDHSDLPKRCNNNARRNTQKTTTKSSFKYALCGL